MLLAVDIGNTEIVICCMQDGNRRTRFTLSSDKARSIDEYSALMEIILVRNGISVDSLSGSIIASVVPQLTETIAAAILAFTGRKPLIVGPGVKNGLKIRMDAPTELGADLVAAAVGAITKYPLPGAIINMGTATAIGVIDSNSCYIGGVLCPGVNLSRNSLTKATSQLPDVSLDGLHRVIGKNTKECLQSGIIIGTAAMLDGMVDRIEAELGCSLKSIVATGVSALQILPNCSRHDIVYNEDLVMEGLWAIWHKNREGKK